MVILTWGIDFTNFNKTSSISIISVLNHVKSIQHLIIDVNNTLYQFHTDWNHVYKSDSQLVNSPTTTCKIEILTTSNQFKYITISFSDIDISISLPFISCMVHGYLS